MVGAGVTELRDHDGVLTGGPAARSKSTVSAVQYQLNPSFLATPFEAAPPPSKTPVVGVRGQQQY